MYNLEEIEVLLDKYWLGETTLEEERALKTYFTSNLLPDSLKPVAPLFQALRQEQALQLERDAFVPMAVHTSNRLRYWAAAASIAALLAVGTWWALSSKQTDTLAAYPTVPALPVTKPAELVAPTAQAPALTVVEPKAISKAIVKSKKPPPAVPDAATEQAMEEIKAALALLSSKLNKSSRTVVKDLNHLETMDRFIKPKSEG